MSRISQIFDGLKIQKSLILPFAPATPLTAGNIFMQGSTGDLYVRNTNAETLNFSPGE
ncbi:hypothetical protein MAR_ORF041 [Marseillevirus marseillevirus]|uniref:Uncharacterized protein n=1 Tax=Marseillevirus marseillevirus TaxID=694581 RepID=D2XA53_GBMV|nr:hypothetical protein MAR_ORF041 [Marseillevirus marseillevirus]ADB03830.1 hypothetical protein MAR_ORF041 [Marseillevirus marseillevirus]